MLISGLSIILVENENKRFIVGSLVYPALTMNMFINGIHTLAGENGTEAAFWRYFSYVFAVACFASSIALCFLTTAPYSAYVSLNLTNVVLVALGYLQATVGQKLQRMVG